MSQIILIVDDDPVQRRLLATMVECEDHRVLAVDGGEAALATLASPQNRRIALVILDLVMPDLDGMAVLARLRDAGSTIPVIVLTAGGRTDAVSAAMSAGAVDFVVTPVSTERLRVSIENALRLGALRTELARAQHVVAGTFAFHEIIADSPAMERVIGLGQRAATTQMPILIEGEPGVGKQLLARAIHGSGPRRSKPFVTVHCGSLPEHLVESTLFGCAKGAAVDAADGYPGKFREAQGGTLFLTGIDALSPSIQAKLMLALQTSAIMPVGASQPARTDVRIIATTGSNMLDLVKAARFREDLYYRLNVFPIRLPPLRERREDIPELVIHFTARFAALEGKNSILGVAADALDLLFNHDWPGNIRQLENAVFRAVHLADGAVLTRDAFPQITMETAPSGTPRPVETISLPASPPAAADRSAAETSTQAVDAFDAQGDIRPMAEIELDVLRLALKRYRGRMAVAARKLGLGRSTLYRKVKEFGISDTVAGIEPD